MALELLREEKTLSQLASVGDSPFPRRVCWRSPAWEGFSGLFSDPKTQDLKAAREREVTTLYPEIGPLTTPLNGLKKVRDEVSQDPRRPGGSPPPDPDLTLTEQSTLAGVSRSSLS